MADLREPTHWPSWPSGEKGQCLLDVEAHLPIDNLFLLTLGGPNEFRERVRKASGTQNLSTSGWVDSLANAVAAPPTTTAITSISELRHGFVSFSSFHAPGRGSGYPTKELLRLHTMQPGVSFLVEQCVATEAPYGDRFRAVLRHSYEATTAGRTRLRIDVTMVYLSPVNGMIKAIIGKGAKDGMSKSVAAFHSSLKQYTQVQPYSGGAMETKPALPLARPSSPLDQRPTEHPASSLTEFMGRLLGSDLIAALEPWAAFLHAALAHLSALQWLTPATVLFLLLIVVCFGALRTGLAILRFFESAAANPHDLFAHTASICMKYVHVPTGINEILSTCAFAALIRTIANRIAASLPGPPSGQQSREQGSVGTENNADSSIGNGRSAVGAVASQPESLSPSSDDAETMSGVKYDGYQQAIASATSNSAEFSATPSARSWATFDQKSEAALQQIRRGLELVASPFTTMSVSQKTASETRLDVKKALSGDGDAKSGCEKGDAGNGSRSSKVGMNDGDVAAGRGPKSRKNKVQPVDQSTGIADTTHEIASSKQHEACEDKKAVLQPVEACIGGQSSDESSDAAAAGNAAEVALGRMAEPSSSTSTSSPRTASPAHSPRVLGPSVDDIKSDVEAVVPREAIGYQPLDLSSTLLHQAVVMELYENQRYQPFRGWGSTWPGHFLPTDRTLRWSLRDSAGVDVVTSQVAADVAPMPPPGWRWVEPAWRLDLGGVLSDATDNEGWCYGLDFPLVTYPFAPGAGRKRMADFVRRRRWLRTRIPDMPSAASSPTTLAAQDASSSSSSSLETSVQQDVQTHDPSTSGQVSTSSSIEIDGGRRNESTLLQPSGMNVEVMSTQPMGLSACLLAQQHPAPDPGTNEMDARLAMSAALQQDLEGLKTSPPSTAGDGLLGGCKEEHSGMLLPLLPHDSVFEETATLLKETSTTSASDEKDGHIGGEGALHNHDERHDLDGGEVVADQQANESKTVAKPSDSTSSPREASAAAGEFSVELPVGLDAVGETQWNIPGS